MKLLGSAESKITEDKNGENVPHLENVELVLVHCNLVNNDYQQDSRILYTFVPNKALVVQNGVIWYTLIRTQQTQFSPPILWGLLAHFEPGSILS